MLEYRVFYLDEWGQICGRDEFSARNDDGALETASQRVISRLCSAYEVWEGSRRVKVVKFQK